MRKKIIVFALVTCMLLAFSACSHSINIEASDVDNSYNNIRANLTAELVQIEDKLYFDYQKRIGETKLYKISENNTKKLDEDISLDFVYQGTILNPYTNPITCYDETTGGFDVYNNIKYSDGITPETACVINGTIYFDYGNTLYRYNGTAFETVATEKDLGLHKLSLSEIYIGDEEIYYYQKTGEMTTLYKYNTISNNIEAFDIGRHDLRNVIAQDNCVYFLDELSLYKADFTDKTVTELFADEKAAVDCYNVCSEIVVAANANGVYISDKGKEFKIISDDPARSLYILDSKYVYYIKTEGELMRVTRDGKTKEQVF